MRDLGIHVCRVLSCAPPHSSCPADHTKEVVFAPEAALIYMGALMKEPGTYSLKSCPEATSSFNCHLNMAVTLKTRSPQTDSKTLTIVHFICLDF